MIKKALFFLALLPLVAQGQQEGVELTLRYFDKSIYYPETPVQLKLTLSNFSSRPLLLKITNERVFNTDFEVLTLKNLPVEPSENYFIKQHAEVPFFFREFTLQPEEEYSFFLDLRDFVNVGTPGVYTAMALFYPDFSDKSAVIRSNRIQVTIHPPSTDRREKEEDLIEYQTEKILQAHPLPPDEVVDYLLKARQRDNWEKFLLYLDLEALMLRDSAQKRLFKKSSEEQQLQMLRHYRLSLKESLKEGSEPFIARPDSFSILRTSYTKEKAKVIVKEEFYRENFVLIKEYTYYLDRQGALWKLYDYSVENRGTRRREIDRSSLISAKG